MPRLEPPAVIPAAPADMSFCSHDMPRATCSFCKPSAAAPARRPLQLSLGMGPWFTAQWSGECSGCGESICAGDRIRADGEGRGGYLCHVCGDAE